MTLTFGVVGDPVSHSRSPVMHTAAFHHLGIDATYGLIATPYGAFSTVVGDLETGSLDGVNVTMPHKQHAFDAAAAYDNGVARLGAVNTLLNVEGTLVGFNTDVAGVEHAIDRLGVEPGAPVHILGSGGAAAAAIAATEGRHAVSLASRNSDRAERLRARMAAHCTVWPWGTWPEGAIIVNATPIGMHGEPLPEGMLESSIGLVDMPYGNAVTPAIATARHLGLPHADGIVMLVGQAAAAFEVFTGVPAPLDVMESAARRP